MTTPDEARAVMPDYDKQMMRAWLQDARRAQIAGWLVPLLAVPLYAGAWGLMSGIATLQHYSVQMAEGGMALIYIIPAIAAAAGTAVLGGYWLGQYLCRARLRYAQYAMKKSGSGLHASFEAARIISIDAERCRVTYSITCPKTGAVALRRNKTLRQLMRDAQRPELALQAKRRAA